MSLLKARMIDSFTLVHQEVRRHNATFIAIEEVYLSSLPVYYMRVHKHRQLPTPIASKTEARNPVSDLRLLSPESAFGS